MSSGEYWKNRAVWRMYEAMVEAEATADIVSGIYLKSFNYIEKQLKNIFEKFRTRYGLSEEKAAQLIEQMRSPEDIEGLKQLLRNDPADVEKTEILVELESAAYAARLKRLATLQAQISTVMHQVYKQELLESTALYKTLIEDTYYKTVFDIQQQAGVGFSFSYVDEKQVDTVLKINWSGKNYSERIWDNTKKVAEKVQEEVLMSLLTGKTEREAAEKISKQFASGAAQARRLIRTESSFVSSELNFQAYEEAEIEEYQFLATLDLKTSKVCRELDGKIFKVSERQVGVNCNPMHPWCRSTTVSVVDREYIKTMTRRTRDPKTGKTIKVPRSMTYEEWYEKYVKGVPEVEQKEKMIQNKSSDRNQHRRYQAVLGKDISESLAEFQEMKYTDTEKWNGLKRKYRVVNAYESNTGDMPASKIYELDQKAFDAKKQFTGRARRQANIAVAEIDGDIKYGNSQINKTEDPLYKNYKGNKQSLVLKTANPEFKTKAVGSHLRDIDSEAKLLEHAATIAKDGKPHTVNLLSEKCMCDSCIGVLKQFQEKYPNVKVNAVSNKKERVAKNKNNPWAYRKE